MYRTIRSNGIVSYAGLEKNKLLSYFRSIGESGTKTEPAFLPLFPAELIQTMPYVGPSGRYSTPSGFTVDPVIYHNQLLQDFPELYTGYNRLRCIKNNEFMGGEMLVDECWAGYFPQYRQFLGDRLYIRLIGGGHQAVAIPQSLYPLRAESLRRMEDQMGIGESAARCAEYIRNRIHRGEKYDSLQFEKDYLAEFSLTAPWISQQEILNEMKIKAEQHLLFL